jgi:hypothetical protein
LVSSSSTTAIINPESDGRDKHFFLHQHHTTILYPGIKLIPLPSLSNIFLSSWAGKATLGNWDWLVAASSGQMMLSSPLQASDHIHQSPPYTPVFFVPEMDPHKGRSINCSLESSLDEHYVFLPELVKKKKKSLMHICLDFFF